jgi:hypothetical protein
LQQRSAAKHEEGDGVVAIAFFTALQRKIKRN